MSSSDTAAPATAPREGDGVLRGGGPRIGTWRPLIWVGFAAVAAAVPPTPSWLLAGFLLAAGLLITAGVRVSGIPLRLTLFGLAVAVGVVATVLTPQNGLAVIPIFAAPAIVAREVPWRRAVFVFGVVSTALCALSLFWVSRTGWASLGALSVPFIVMGTWDRAALRREHDRVLDLLGALESRRDVEVRAAAATERARIARDLHDVLAHTLSGLSLHLQGIRAVLGNRSDIPGEVIASVDRAADLARTGLDEARRAVAALREDTTQAPGTGELTALVGGHDGAELAVDGDFDALAAPARETAFATVRESLTNAERHAPGGHVTVRMTVGDGLVVSITDDGAALPVTAGDHGGGHGLRGLAERAVAAGGTLDAHAEPPGWVVELRIPGRTTGSPDDDDEGAR